MVAAAPFTLTSAPPPGWRRTVAWGAVALIAIGIAYLVQRAPAQTRPQDSVVVDNRSSIETAEQRKDEPARESPPVDATETTARATAAEVPDPATTPRRSAPSKTAQVAAPTAVSQTPTRPKAGARGALTSANTQPSPGTAASSDVIASDASPRNSKSETRPDAHPPQQLARANVPQPAAGSDGGHTLTRALEKCGEQKFLASVLCEQKARLQYCEGKWGQDPQCAARTRVD